MSPPSLGLGFNGQICSDSTVHSQRCDILNRFKNSASLELDTDARPFLLKLSKYFFNQNSVFAKILYLRRIKRNSVNMTISEFKSKNKHSHTWLYYLFQLSQWFIYPLHHLYQLAFYTWALFIHLTKNIFNTTLPHFHDRFSLNLFACLSMLFSQYSDKNLILIKTDQNNFIYKLH